MSFCHEARWRPVAGVYAYVVARFCLAWIQIKRQQSKQLEDIKIQWFFMPAAQLATQLNKTNTHGSNALDLGKYLTEAGNDMKAKLPVKRWKKTPLSVIFDVDQIQLFAADGGDTNEVKHRRNIFRCRSWKIHVLHDTWQIYMKTH